MKILILLFLALPLYLRAQPAPPLEATPTQVSAGILHYPFVVTPFGLGGGGSGGGTNNSSTNGMTIYVAPTGSDTASGSVITPVATVYQATLMATNPGSLIVQLPGTNYNELANPHLLRMSNGVSFWGWPGSVLALTNFNGQIIGGANFRPAMNSFVDSLNINYFDASFTTAGPFGYYGAAGGSDSGTDVTNCTVNDLHIVSPTQGIHLEGNSLGNNIQITFNSPYVLAGGNAFQDKNFTNNGGNVRIVVNNPTFIVTNFPAHSENNKPLRLFSLGSQGSLTINGGYTRIDDNLSTNGIWCYVEQDVAGLSINGMIIESTTTNVANSADIQVIAGTIDDAVLNAVKTGLQPLTILLGSLVFPYSRTNVTATVTAGGLTNNTAFPMIVNVTVGTALAVKDVNGNGIFAPVLTDPFPLKPGWRFTGTTVTGQAYIISNP